MVTFYEYLMRESDAGPIVGSHTNDSLLQASGILSKYGSKEATNQYFSDKADCKYLGKCGAKRRRRNRKHR